LADEKKWLVDKSVLQSHFNDLRERGQAIFAANYFVK